MTTIRTTAGRVRGREWGRGLAFLGVPYAEPPYGERRFRAPEPRRPWPGVLDCLAYGPTPQRRPMASVTAIPEPSIPGTDVLTLNVFTPGPAPGGLPVLVYIHGGGYIAGSPASPWYDGAAFTRDGVVVVTIAYRLAFEGYGHLPGAPANRGVRDQILALRWVCDNIAAFGGDPGKVTIAGQSAGGGSVMHLLVAPAARGLFRSVITISGSPGDRPQDEAAERTRELAGKLGVTPDLAGFAGVGEMALVQAQGIGAGFGGPPSREGLLAAVAALSAGLRMAPTVDGEVLPWTVADGLARGEGAGVALLAGATRDEFSAIALGAAGLLADDDPAGLLVAAGLDPGTAARYAAALPGRSPAAVLGQSVTDRVFRRRVLQWAALRAGATAPTFVYDFAWRSAVDGLSGHCLDVPFAWDVLGERHVARLAGEAPPQDLADAVHGGYVAFVRDGDPGWPAWAGAGPVMTWDTKSEVTDAAAYDSARHLT
jgi:para-nitrobenzyl esterase